MSSTEAPVWVVAGPTGALGTAVVRAAAPLGITLVLAGRKVRVLEQLYDQIRAAGGVEPALYPINFEGARPDDYLEMAGRIEQELGRCDALLWTVAQFTGLRPLDFYEAEDWLRILHTNLTAPVFLLRAFAPLLRAQRGTALFALEDPRRTEQAYWGAYGAAKAGLEQLLRTVAAEYRNTGPRVLGVRLPALQSGMRQLAYPAEAPGQAADPTPYAERLVELLRAPVEGPVLDWSARDNS